MNLTRLMPFGVSLKLTNLLNANPFVSAGRGGTTQFRKSLPSVY